MQLAGEGFTEANEPAATVNRPWWRRPLGVLLAMVGVAAVVWHVYYAVVGLPASLWMRPAHLMFFAPLPFVLTKSRTVLRRTLDRAFGVLVAAACAYVLFDFERISTRFWMVDEVLPLDYLFGGILTAGLIEGCRRYFGWALPLLAVFALLYAKLGSFIPGRYGHDPQPLSVLVDQLYLSDLGIFGPVLGASAEIVILFVIFGLFLAYSGIDRTLFDLAKLTVGRATGGIAKVAVGASALFGSISGSTTANIVATGSVTIPMMRSRGYDPTFAAAVEAAASTGGQIMPPVMGATAFLMAALLGVSYLEVVRSALVSGIAYFVMVFLIIHIYAIRQQLPGLEQHEIPGAKEVVRRLHLFLPIAILVALMVMQFSTQLSVLVATGSVLLVSVFSSATRISPVRIVEACRDVLNGVAPIAIACAAAGIIVGVISMTGIGLKISSTIAMIGGESRMLALLLTMVVTIILGMGVPTPAAYITAAAIMAPALVRLGLDQMVAHMFVFYFACLSSITPPVAIGAYVAAGMAGAPPLATGFRACRIGIAAFVVPFVFAYDPGPMLLRDGLIANTVGITLVFGGLAALVFAFEGFWARHLGAIERLLLLIAGALQLAVLLQDWQRALGLLLLVVIGLFQYRRSAGRSAPARSPLP